MMSENLLLAVLGWSSAINVGILTVSAISLLFFGDPILRLHQKWFGLSESELRQAYFRYLANYKILTLIFNLVPYLALRVAIS